MTTLTNFRISTRLAGGFALILVLSIVSTSLALVNARNNAAATRKMMDKPVAMERYISTWSTQTSIAMGLTSMIVQSSDDALGTKFADVLAGTVAKGSEAVKGIESLLSTEEEKAAFKDIVEARAAYQKAKENVVNLRKSGGADAAESAYRDSFLPISKGYLEKVSALLARQRKSIDDTAAAIDQANDRDTTLVIVLSVLIVALSAVIAYVISRSITVPLKHAIEVAGTVASGDLTTVIDKSGKDEIGELMQALHQMNTSLRNIVGQVKTGTYAIAGAADEISTGNRNLSARTEQQAGSLEETAASIEELTSTVKQNSENANQANQLALTASEVAAQGGVVVSQVVETMGSINESAKKIVDIIGVIDGIAFQTNILALNAAVEAARAGEQGRGFAVVATEVRNLAQRSAAAAKEIKGLIGDSVEKVNVGSKLVDQAGTTMQEVVASVKRVTHIMSEITVASREQSAGIEQVNHAVMEMDSTTQQNAALVEQATAAAQSMQEQAAELAKMVDTFKVERGQFASAAPARVPASVAPVRAASPKPGPARLPGNKASAPVVVRPKLPAKPVAVAKTDDWEEF